MRQCPVTCHFGFARGHVMRRRLEKQQQKNTAFLRLQGSEAVLSIAC